MTKRKAKMREGSDKVIVKNGGGRARLKPPRPNSSVRRKVKKSKKGKK